MIFMLPSFVCGEGVSLEVHLKCELLLLPSSRASPTLSSFSVFFFFLRDVLNELSALLTHKHEAR